MLVVRLSAHCRAKIEKKWQLESCTSSFNGWHMTGYGLRYEHLHSLYWWKAIHRRLCALCIGRLFRNNGTWLLSHSLLSPTPKSYPHPSNIHSQLCALRIYYIALQPKTGRSQATRKGYTLSADNFFRKPPLCTFSLALANELFDESSELVLNVWPMRAGRHSQSELLSSLLAIRNAGGRRLV